MAAAQRDLNEIFVYWSQRVGLQTSDRLVDSITERFWIIGEFPKAGRTASEIAPGMRSFPAGEYLIYYRIARLTVDVVHIFHGARDQRGAFKTAKKRSSR
ncbi:MAG: type II toxin-antitoxin system RelE/ParE family toxin [Acidobacteriaceae bacterium]